MPAQAWPHTRLLATCWDAAQITFPLVWTNTCCSHQLTGFDPDEVDDSAAVASLQVLGSKHAARRKLQHELGIPPSQAWPTTAKCTASVQHLVAAAPCLAWCVKLHGSRQAVSPCCDHQSDMTAGFRVACAAQVPLESFRFWTRLHYCAADQGPDGQPTGWGEHEMDYILGIKADVMLRPHPDEVQSVCAASTPCCLCTAPASLRGGMWMFRCFNGAITS